MSSILSRNYSENLRRIYSRTDETTRRDRTNGPNKSSFENVLQSAQETKTPKNNSDLTQVHKVQREPVRNAPDKQIQITTNLTQDEQKRSAAVGVQRLNPQQDQSKKIAGPTPDSVKSSKVDVKNPSVREPGTGVPSAPVLLSAKVMDSEAPAKVARARLEPPTPNFALEPSVTELLSDDPQPFDPAMLRKMVSSYEKQSSPLNYSNSDLKSLITTAGKYHGVDPKLGIAVAQAESGLRTNAVSNDGHRSKGIFQLLDSTGKDLIERYDVKERYNPFDPALNTYLGVGYLRQLHDLFSENTELGYDLRTHAAKSSSHLEKLAVAAFNAGQGNVARAQEKARQIGRDPSDYDAIKEFLPSSTRTYVARVTQLKRGVTDIA